MEVLAALNRLIDSEFNAVNGALIQTGRLGPRDHAKLEKVPAAPLAARPDEGAPDPVLCVSAWRGEEGREAIKSSGGRISFGTEVHPGKEAAGQGSQCRRDIFNPET